MKRRKYPLKAGTSNLYFQRYFTLEKGILKYSKSQQDIMRGKLHGTLDISLAVMSINKKSKRIDLDAGDNIYHLKAKSSDIFYIWVTKLCAHRIFKKNEAMSVHRGVLHALSLGQSSLPAMSMSSPGARRKNIILHKRGEMFVPASALRQLGLCVPGRDQPGPQSSSKPGVNSKVSAWLQQTQDIDATTNELARCQAELTDLALLIQRLHWLEGGLPITNMDLEMRISMQNLTLEKPKKKGGKGFGHSRTLSRVEAMGEMYPAGNLGQLSGGPETAHGDLRRFTESARVSALRTRGADSGAREAPTGLDRTGHEAEHVHQLATLCSTLSELDIQSRLTKVHSFSLSSDSSDESFCTVQPEQTPSLHSQRPPSVAESMAEYYDASEVIVCESSSEAEASDESGLSDITTTSTSEPEEGHSAATLNYRDSLNNAPDKRPVHSETGRRTTLPAPCADNSHIGVMAILYNNIGKDLSRVSMPVALNEPLCLLQRVSEELEYSELLDTANHTDDPYERMVYVAAFSISGYAWASWRNRYKPFNPVLGETYESVREDRGFRYVSEQVCHHPPISACHAESENFTFWQDQRWKNKFWGKSLEIISSGPVHVTLPRYDDHYEWNKVVTCIHNVLTQTRTLEHYGEVLITNKNSDVCTCKITFVKARYWSSTNTKNEVHGEVLNRSGDVGIFCDTLPTPKCIWKPHEQPEDYFQFYGFSRYARELNELTPQLERVLPPTDTRFRPDQRLLEEGKVAEADKKKDEVEQKQRDRRKELAKRNEEHQPRFFYKSVDESGREVWLYNGTYWKTRDEPGFAYTDNLDLWC
ncbi:hypothetical protein WMY93_003357 [Mugilogobius chulae]|uniref:Oxysterol-binding protein n=1 Tax=Mugilogobius chulae TaxID=88201 RepID=A0AAW0PWD2_9GOBI